MAPAGRGVAHQRGTLGLDAFEAAVRFLDQRRRRALAERDFRARGVEHAHRLVGQLASADVAVRQAHSLGDGFVEHADVEVRLHQRHHAAQHGGGQRLAGLLDLHDLEAPRQRRVLLEVLLVLAPGGGGDGAQLAARQRRLEQVGRIALPGLAARADHGVGLVDEEHDRVRALLHFGDHVLQAVLELALHARAGLQEAHVERVQRHGAQRLGHVLRGDAQCQPFDHGRLADAGLAREDRVVLATAHQDVDDLADLGVAADHRVERTVLRALREVRGELVERGRLAGHARGQRVGWRLLRVAFGGCARGASFRRFARTVGELVEVVLQVFEADLGKERRAALRQLREVGLGQQREQQVARADLCRVRVERGEQPRLLEQLLQMLREHRRARVAVLEGLDLALQVRLDRSGADAVGVQHAREVVVGLLQQRQEQVLQVDLVVAVGQAQVGGALRGHAGAGVELGDQCLQRGAHERWCSSVGRVR
ncbi:hypothetical protein FQZ97_414990 [compost metagenome]